MALIGAFLNILQGPGFLNALPDLLVFVAPLWIAVLFGVLVGWIWRPNWANSAVNSLTIPTNNYPSIDFVSSIPNFSSLKSQLPSCFFMFSDNGSPEIGSSGSSTVSFSDSRLGFFTNFF